MAHVIMGMARHWNTSTSSTQKHFGYHLVTWDKLWGGITQGVLRSTLQYYSVESCFLSLTAKLALLICDVEDLTKSS